MNTVNKIIQNKCVLYKVAIGLVLSICVLVSCWHSDVQAKEKNSFLLNVKLGLNNFVKAEKDMPVEIRILNNHDDFNGTVEVVLQSNDLNVKKIVYSKNIRLKSGQTSVYQMSIPWTVYNANYKIVIRNKKGSIVLEKAIEYTSVSQGELTTGVFSNNREKYDIWENANISDQTTTYSNRMIYLKDTDFPINDEMLAEMDCILIDDPDAISLSKEQMTHLEKWMDKGGVIFLMQCQKDSSFFANMSKARVDDIVTQTKSCDSYYLTKEPQVVMIKAKIKSEILHSEKEINSLYLAVPELLNQVYSEDSLIDNMKYSNLMDYVHTLKQPNIYIYIIILLLYIVVVGPILYFWFEHKKRKEFIWLGMVLVSLLFSGILFLCNQSTNVKQLQATIITFFNNDDDTFLYSNIQSPQNNKMSFSYNGNVDKVENVNYEYFGTQTENRNVEYHIDDDKYQYAMNQYSGFRTLSQVAARKDSSNVEGFQADLHLINKTIKGTITNMSGYNLKQVLVYYHGAYYKYSQLSKHQSISLQEKTVWKQVKSQLSGAYFNDEVIRNGKQKFNYMQMIEDRIFDMYLNQNTQNNIYLIGIADDFDGKYIATKADEKDIAVYFQKVQLTDQSEKYSIDLNRNNMVDCNANWTIGNDGKYYDFKSNQVSYFISDVKQLKRICLSKPVDKTQLRVLLYNYHTKQYDDVFDNDTCEISMPLLKQYIDSNECKIKYISVKGKIAQGQGNGVELPRIDIVTQE